jgi:hypothetical protein
VLYAVLGCGWFVQSEPGNIESAYTLTEAGHDAARRFFPRRCG